MYMNTFLNMKHGQMIYLKGDKMKTFYLIRLSAPFIGIENYNEKSYGF